jgi:sphingomyelin phosphodiesterase acid-like 3
MALKIVKLLLYLLVGLSRAVSDMNFFVISDIHYDILYSPYHDSIQDCHTLPVSLLKDAYYYIGPAPGVQPIGRFRCDSSLNLLNSAFFSMSSINPNPDFILILGDFIAHNTMYVPNAQGRRDLNYNIGLLRLSFMQISDVVRSYFPSTRIISVLGNNDGYEDYRDIPEEDKLKYYQYLWNLWQPLVGEMSSDFMKNGYYTTKYKDIKFICLNSNHFSIRQSDSEVQAQEQMEWFEDELRKSEENSERVVIVMHTPPGISIYGKGNRNWNDLYIDSFISSLKTHSHLILYILSGHLHISTFQLIQDLNIPIIVHSSLSPIYQNNPTFRYYEISSYNTTYHDYILDLFSKTSDFELQASTTISSLYYSSYLSSLSLNTTSIMDFLINSKGLRFPYENGLITESRIWEITTLIYSDSEIELGNKIVLCSMKWLKFSDFDRCVSE